MPLPLPGEVLSVVLSHLSTKDLFQCIQVSALWYHEALPHLYRTVTINKRDGIPPFPLHLPAILSNRHLIHHVDWFIFRDFTRGGFPNGPLPVQVFETDLLEVLLDYKLPESLPLSEWIDKTDQGGKDDLRKSALPLRPGPNRPLRLKSLTLLGYFQRINLLENTLEHLSMSLTFLRLMVQGAYMANLEWLLETLPLLKHLSLEGDLIQFLPPSPRPSSYSDTNTITNSTVESDQSHYPLETLTFMSALMTRPGPTSFDIFKRLPNLKNIRIIETQSWYRHPDGVRPGEFGRVLEKYCPKLERIETDGAVPVWFFRLPPLSPAIRTTMRKLEQEHAEQLAQLRAEEFQLRGGMWSTSVAPRAANVLLQKQLEQQEREDLVFQALAGRIKQSYFRNLKRLEMRDHTLSAQDLVCLGIQAQFLTHVTLQRQLYTSSQVWNLYETDPEVVGQGEDAKITASSATVNNPEKLARMRRRSPIQSRDVLFFLEVCASLQHFSAGPIAVYFDEMLEHEDNDSDSEDHESQEGFVRSADGDGRDRRRIQRWACEGSLESLEIGFVLETTNPNDHRLVWAHLGRFRKLRSLTLGGSNLIPSLKHGIGALVPLSVGGRGVNETMEKILSFGSMWTSVVGGGGAVLDVFY
ncbi:hypothetical protein K457DRAFT_15823 [Linnemannia elongata AG-77]|uniref:F-box domain-containing protein n=1 Tax=Linnemannia elongata AG-77 TaxID=1314771 RepID=A0A197K5J6_9FUNG|nr:hypothetical protein K457DRAFT_15823 [Linnemannia elongata AG-77]